MTTYYKKAWEIIGYTLDGGLYCLECAENGDAMPFGNPVWVSDELHGLACESCHEQVKA